MDYIIANYRIRTVGAYEDLVANKLNGFKPFAVDADPAAQPTLTIKLDHELCVADYELEELHAFEFDDANRQCALCKCKEGYLFYMRSRLDQSNIVFLSTNSGSEVVSNAACQGSPDPTLLRFGLWMMFGLAINPLGAIAIHSSVLIKDGYAVLCLGESGTGKSTHTRLWREHIAGTTLLNDDSPIIRIVDGVATAFGSAWSGKTPCYKQESYPIRAFLRLSQAPHNRIMRHNVISAIGALLPSCPPAFAYDVQLQDNICETLSQMISKVPVYHLECLPDAAAAELSYSTIFGIKK